MRLETSTIGALALAALVLMLSTGPARAAARRTVPLQGTAQAAEHPRLLRSQTDVYVVQGRFRRWVVSPQVFADYRFREEWVETVTDDQLSSVPRGPDLLAGPVLRASDGTLWIVYQGARRRVIGPDAFAPLYLSPADAQPADDAKLRDYPEGRGVGNPPHPWLVVAPLVLLAAFGCLWWSAGGARSGAAHTASWRSPIVWLLAGVVLLLRLYYVVLFPWLPDGADGPSYVGVARSLMASGRILDDGPAAGLTHITSPLYPIILAATSWAVGLARGSVVGWKVLQVAVSLLLVPLVGDLAERLYGRRAGFVAALIALLSPLWLYSAELLQYELWLGLLLAGGVWAAVRARSSSYRAYWWIAASGLLLGLAALMQLKAAVVLVAAVAYLVWPRRCGTAGWNGRTMAILVFTLPAITPLGLWALRNEIVHGEPILGSTGGGALVWMGVHPGATGGYMQLPRPQAFYEHLARYPSGSSRSNEARAYTELAWEAITGHPAHFAVLALVKLERFWWTIAPERLGEHLERRTTAFLGYQVDGEAQLLFSKLLHLAGLGAVTVGLLWGGRIAPDAGEDPSTPDGRWLVIAVVGLFWASHVPFIAEPRYRIPIEPLLHVLQAAGLVLIRDALDRYRGGTAVEATAPSSLDFGLATRDSD